MPELMVGIDRVLLTVEADGIAPVPGRYPNNVLAVLITRGARRPRFFINCCSEILVSLPLRSEMSLCANTDITRRARACRASPCDLAVVQIGARSGNTGTPMSRRPSRQRAAL